MMLRYIRCWCYVVDCCSVNLPTTHLCLYALVRWSIRWFPFTDWFTILRLPFVVITHTLLLRCGLLTPTHLTTLHTTALPHVATPHTTLHVTDTSRLFARYGIVTIRFTRYPTFAIPFTHLTPRCSHRAGIPRRTTAHAFPFVVDTTRTLFPVGVVFPLFQTWFVPRYDLPFLVPVVHWFIFDCLLFRLRWWCCYPHIRCRATTTFLTFARSCCCCSFVLVVTISLCLRSRCYVTFIPRDPVLSYRYDDGGLPLRFPRSLPVITLICCVPLRSTVDLLLRNLHCPTDSHYIRFTMLLLILIYCSRSICVLWWRWRCSVIDGDDSFPRLFLLLLLFPPIAAHIPRFVILPVLLWNYVGLHWFHGIVFSPAFDHDCCSFLHLLLLLLIWWTNLHLTFPIDDLRLTYDPRFVPVVIYICWRICPHYIYSLILSSRTIYLTTFGLAHTPHYRWCLHGVPVVGMFTVTTWPGGRSFVDLRYAVFHTFPQNSRLFRNVVHLLPDWFVCYCDVPLHTLFGWLHVTPALFNSHVTFTLSIRIWFVVTTVPLLLFICWHSPPFDYRCYVVRWFYDYDSICSFYTLLLFAIWWWWLLRYFNLLRWNSHVNSPTPLLPVHYLVLLLPVSGVDFPLIVRCDLRVVLPVHTLVPRCYECRCYVPVGLLTTTLSGDDPVVVDHSLFRLHARTHLTVVVFSVCPTYVFDHIRWWCVVVAIYLHIPRYVDLPLLLMWRLHVDFPTHTHTYSPTDFTHTRLPTARFYYPLLYCDSPLLMWWLMVGEPWHCIVGIVIVTIVIPRWLMPVLVIHYIPILFWYIVVIRHCCYLLIIQRYSTLTVDAIYSLLFYGICYDCCYRFVRLQAPFLLLIVDATICWFIR